jgi:glucose-6-phosphate isomerase
MASPRHAPSWPLLEEEARRVEPLHLRDLFARDPLRAQRMSLSACGIFLDYSKHRIEDQTVALLIELARSQGVEARREEMFGGAKINASEGRAVLHTALRADPQAVIEVGGRNVVPDVVRVRDRTSAFAERVRSGGWRGYDGEAITDVVNIGIGGSDLGPRMVCQALAREVDPRLAMHFVSNVDGAELAAVLRRVSPKRTLFIVASKTFTTQETLTSAKAAREWLLGHARDPAAIARHFVAVSSNTRAVSEFGIDPANMFEFWDWVGGRYSLWSAIGLAIEIAIGPGNFSRLLAGARAMDHHFRSEPLERNMPVLMALLGIWYSDFLGAATHLVAPYNQALARLPAYLQQLEMESNGKSVSRDGEVLDYASCPVVWGETAINGQHAFFQLVHQGTQLIPVDFIAAVENPDSPADAHAILLANCLAQAEALMQGKSVGDAEAELASRAMGDEARKALARQRAFEGNRPSSMLLLDRIDPSTLGALIALYEHKVFVQGTIWNLNSFDQWGVELGKQLAARILPELGDGSGAGAHDASTAQLIARCRRP